MAQRRLGPQGSLRIGIGDNKMTKTKGMNRPENASQAKALSAQTSANSSQVSSTGSQSTPSSSPRVSRYQASEEEQRQFASNYCSELVISFGLSTRSTDNFALLGELIKFCSFERRIAPLPEYWENFCRLIVVGTEETKHLGPLPNTDWIYDSERRKRLADQLNYAHAHNSLQEANKYLRG